MMKRKMKKVLSLVLTLAMVITMTYVGNVGDLGTQTVKAADEPTYNATNDILLCSNDSFTMEQGSKSLGVTVAAEQEYYISFTAQTSGEIYFDYRGSNSRVYLGQTQCAALGISGGNVWPQGDIGLGGDGARVTIKSSGEKATIWINGTAIVTDAALGTTGESGIPKISWASTTATFTNVKVWKKDPAPHYNADTDTLKCENASIELAEQSSTYFDTGLSATDSYYMSLNVKSSSPVNISFRQGAYINVQSTGYQLVGTGADVWVVHKTNLATGAVITIYSTPDDVTIWVDGEVLVENVPLTATGKDVKPGIGWTFTSSATITDAKVWVNGKEPEVVNDEPTYNEATDTIKYETTSLSVPAETASLFSVNIPNTKAYYMTMTLQTSHFANVSFRQGAYINVQPDGYQLVGTAADGWVNHSTNLSTGAVVTIYSTPDEVSIWIDGTKIADKVAMTNTDSAVQPGISWSFNDTVTVTDAMVWVEGKEPVVTVDGTPVTAENGQITLGNATYGYYCDGKMYKSGATLDVTDGMVFTSVTSLSVAFDADGKAGIKLDGAVTEDGKTTSGIRYQATVSSNNMEAVASDAITEGMLVTANDIYESKAMPLEKDCTYTKITINNSGWYDSDKDGVKNIGTYCGSVVNIIESNYIRNFIARAFVTITYTDGETLTIYSNMSQPRNIRYIANAIIDNNELGNYSQEEQATIQKFAGK